MIDYTALMITLTLILSIFIIIVYKWFNKPEKEDELLTYVKLNDEISTDGLKRLIFERKLFKFADSFVFAILFSGKSKEYYCSNCDKYADKSHQYCRQCHFPFAGPECAVENHIDWYLLMTKEEKIELAKNIYLSNGHGRVLTTSKIVDIPLSNREARFSLKSG